MNVEMAKSLPQKPAILNSQLASSSLPLMMQQAVAMQQMQFQQALLMQQNMTAQQAANRAATMKSATELAAARAAEISRKLKADGLVSEEKEEKEEEETKPKSRYVSSADFCYKIVIIFVSLSLSLCVIGFEDSFTKKTRYTKTKYRGRQILEVFVVSIAQGMSLFKLLNHLTIMQLETCGFQNLKSPRVGLVMFPSLMLQQRGEFKLEWKFLFRRSCHLQGVSPRSFFAWTFVMVIWL